MIHCYINPFDMYQLIFNENKEVICTSTMSTLGEDLALFGKNKKIIIGGPIATMNNTIAEIAKEYDKNLEIEVIQNV